MGPPAEPNNGRTAVTPEACLVSTASVMRERVSWLSIASQRGFFGPIVISLPRSSLAAFQLASYHRH